MAQEIEPFKESVALDATVGRTNYSGEFNTMALTPDTYGQLGAAVATAASQELSKRRGLQAGLNPSGDALPPLTSADKAYVDAYQTQAAATLSNQGQQVFYKADEAISKLNKIGPDDIANYKKTVQQSLEDLLQYAPNETKHSLFNNFNNTLSNSVHNYESRFITQQKEEQRSNFDLAQSTAQQTVHDSFMNGDPDSATKAIESQIKSISQAQAAGTISAKQAEAQKKAAHINYQSNELIQLGMVAEKEGKTDRWAMHLVDPASKPADTKWGDWESAITNAKQFMDHRASFTQQSAQVIASTGYLDIANESMTPQKLQQYQEDLIEHPLQFNNLAISYAQQQHSRRKAENAINAVAANWQNADVMANASNSDINSGWKQLSNLYQQNQQALGNPVSSTEADFTIAASAAIPVQAYNQALANKVKSNDPGQVMSAIHDYHRLSELGGNKAMFFNNDTDAIGMLNNVETALGSGVPEEEAIAKAADIQRRRKTDPEYASRIDRQTTSYLNEKFNTMEDGFTVVRRQINIPGGSTIENHAALTNTWRKQFTSAMQLTDGDETKSKKMATDVINNTFGVTEINGHKSFMQYPIEKYVDGGELASPLIKYDMHSQIKKSVDENKKVYDAGYQNYYYEIETLPSFEDYQKNKTLNSASGAAEHGSVFKELLSAAGRGFAAGAGDNKPFQQHQVTSKFENSPLKITRVYRDGKKQEWQTYLRSNPYQEVSSVTGKLDGAYDVALYNPKTGAKDSFYGVFPNAANSVGYKPNYNWIRDNFYTLYNAPHPEEQKKQKLEKATKFLEGEKPNG